MDFSNINSNELLDIYEKVENFIKFLDKEYTTNQENLKK